jgi:general secretion pathway protein B
VSFILEALRKSERERERRALPGVADIPTTRRPAMHLPLLLGGLGLLLLLNVLVLGFFALKPAAVPALPAAASAPLVGPAEAARGPVPPRSVRPLGAEASSGEAGAEPALARMPATPVAAAEQRAGAATGGLPLFSELPAAATGGLTQLHIDLHVYSTDAAQRFVVINGQRLREGGLLREGPALEQITPDGAVLSLRGTRFRLARD